MNKGKKELLFEENRVAEEIEEHESTASHLCAREEELEKPKQSLKES